MLADDPSALVTADNIDNLKDKVLVTVFNLQNWFS